METRKANLNSKSCFPHFSCRELPSNREENDVHKSADHWALHATKQCAATAFHAMQWWCDNSCPRVLWLISGILFFYICTDAREPYALRVMKAITGACSKNTQTLAEADAFLQKGENVFSSAEVWSIFWSRKSLFFLSSPCPNFILLAKNMHISFSIWLPYGHNALHIYCPWIIPVCENRWRFNFFLLDAPLAI